MCSSARRPNFDITRAVQQRRGREPGSGRSENIDTIGAPTSIPRPSATGSGRTWLVLAAEGRTLLADQPFGTVASVAAGPAFVDLLRELRPSLAVLSAPPAGSRELLAAVAERRRRPSLRLILLNDPADVTGRLDALALGFDEALPASVDPEELSGRARLLLDGGRPASGDVRHIPVAGEVVLDLIARRVRRRDRDIHLRPKEFALLSLLASDPGRVFSRTELVDRVWGPAYRGGARTVDVHIRWLRAKIEEDPAHPAHVITVRGTGYRLDPPPAEAPAGPRPTRPRGPGGAF
jgi:DNA-binding response OmpR family regulator